MPTASSRVPSAWVHSLSCGRLPEEQAEQLVIPHDSIRLPKGKERDEGHDHHHRSRKDLVSSGADQVVRNLIPAVAVEEPLDHVLEHTKDRDEHPENQRLE